MRTTLSRLSILALALILVAGFAANRAVRAQDAMPKVACDADLILSLYTAEYHFDFAAIHDQMMTADPAMTSVDLNAFDKGQYSLFFDGMMAMMGDNMSMGMMDEATMTSVMDAMAMDSAAMEAAMMEMMPEGSAEMAALVPGTVVGEPAECTALRDELRHFYESLAYSSMMMAQSQ